MKACSSSVKLNYNDKSISRVTKGLREGRAPRESKAVNTLRAEDVTFKMNLSKGLHGHCGN